MAKNIILQDDARNELYPRTVAENVLQSDGNPVSGALRIDARLDFLNTVADLTPSVLKIVTPKGVLTGNETVRFFRWTKTCSRIQVRDPDAPFGAEPLFLEYRRRTGWRPLGPRADSSEPPFAYLSSAEKNNQSDTDDWNLVVTYKGNRQDFRTFFRENFMSYTLEKAESGPTAGQYSARLTIRNGQYKKTSLSMPESKNGLRRVRAVKWGLAVYRENLRISDILPFKIQIFLPYTINDKNIHNLSVDDFYIAFSR